MKEPNGTDAILEKQVTEQQLVPFLGDDPTGGSIYISLPGLCAALGPCRRGNTGERKRPSRQKREGATHWK